MRFLFLFELSSTWPQAAGEGDEGRLTEAPTDCASTEPPASPAVGKASFASCHRADRQENTARSTRRVDVDPGYSRMMKQACLWSCDRHVYFVAPGVVSDPSPTASFRRPGTLLLISDGIFLGALVSFCRNPLANLNLTPNTPNLQIQHNTLDGVYPSAKPQTVPRLLGPELSAAVVTTFLCVS